MSKVSGVSYDENKSLITWDCDGRQRAIELESVDQYILDAGKRYILALSGGGLVPNKLTFINCEDGTCKSVKKPSGFEFYYLADHPQLGVAVVCVSEELVEGWRDWHFAFDPDSIKLSRAVPAY